MSGPVPSGAPGAAGAMWLLARLRLLRILNMFSAFQGRKGANAKSRSATGGKRGARWILAPLVAFGMLFTFANVSRTSLLNLHCKIDHAGHCAAALSQAPREQAMAAIGASLHAAPFSPALAAAATLVLLLLWLVSFLLPLGSRELAQADWDLEWLVTLPVRRGTLLWGRLLERSVANPGGILALWPTCSMLAWYAGHGWLAPPMGAAVAFVLLGLAALARTLADTGLRLSLPPSQLRNLQAMASLLCMPLMYMAISYSIWSNNSFTMDWARAFPAWTLWTPPGLAVRALTDRGAAQAWGAAALLLAQSAALLWAGVALLKHQLRHGVVASGAREAGRAAAGGQAALDDAAAPRWRVGTTLQRRELRLLGRDRAFLVQSLLVPVVIVGSQLLFNGQLSSVTLIGENQQLMAAIAFGIGSYVLMLSAFQTLNTEGNALWMLYTFPRSIEAMLKEKAQLWGALALLYPLIVFGVGLAYSPVFDWRLAGLAAIALAGIPIYTGIAVSLGIFACDPMAQELQARIRPSYSYLYLMLCSLYVYALYAPEWIQSVTIVILTGSLSLALWQKARDELPYLLDPAASPPARVALSDGLIAATLFFVLQALGRMLLARDGHTGLYHTVYAFAIAGAAVYALTRLVYWRHKTGGVPEVLHADAGGKAAALGAATRHGLAAAAVAVLFGAGYLALIRETQWWPAKPPSELRWLVALSVCAAPVFEEFIFRGLIHNGLRRLAGAWPAALGSAALFAIVHPSTAIMPVFVLGLCTAWAYERCKSLLAPMLVHAAYNGAVLAIQAG
ncbi:CPBP family intramembrane glutamic endopeptidase [Pseudoduganella namucuonensis]|uniref:CAAX prenyl protease 2/Lysostaphin resistance protein A-like domain-containing protein n=1 Tax=Pseudoduganella namucuonensis TaxID=1035707 RepID=A0A1I7EXY3_9BURK|nr:CPBP family intramembrane glutamic endopeptidase [Pseudoduganella namucuonensis]SFU28764.1 hypothetical protein SAMN05216552_1001226 [Pseudoduganella namucuonensis]